MKDRTKDLLKAEKALLLRHNFLRMEEAQFLEKGTLDQAHEANALGGDPIAPNKSILMIFQTVLIFYFTL